MKFLSMEHENQLLKLLQRDGTHHGDMERLALFYIISGNIDLYNKMNSIYDFSQHQIEPDCLYDGSVDFCGSSRALVKLAFNLFNGFQDTNVSPLGLLSNLDADNFNIATESMKIRFGYTNQAQSSLDEDDLEL